MNEPMLSRRASSRALPQGSMLAPRAATQLPLLRNAIMAVLATAALGQTLQAQETAPLHSDSSLITPWRTAFATALQDPALQLVTVSPIDLTWAGADGGAGTDANFAFFCLGHRNSSAGGSGAGSGDQSYQLADARIDAAGVNGVRLMNQSGHGGRGGNGSACDAASQGGAGGAGMLLQLTASNLHVATTGAQANGITLMSNGGSGGHGGEGGWWRWGQPGGAGGKGGSAQLLGDGVLTTQGDHSLGILAKSVGGNGGDGGSSDLFGGGGSGPIGAGGGLVVIGREPASAGEAREYARFDITTHGAYSYGIGAYSIGGDGGHGGDGSFFEPTPGAGGGTANSGDVIVNNAGTITTWGAYSTGIAAQSIAGHGGAGGAASSVVFFGAGGGSAGDGGSVKVDNLGAITTHGSYSYAIQAQSIGGGGGTGGSGFGAFYVQAGGGGSGGDGGAVAVSNAGRLETSGLDARGIYAQSIGGAGGDGGDAAGIVALGGSGATTSDGGQVSVANSGAIASAAHAIYAQSVGGGGGNGGDSAGWFSIGGVAGGGGAGSTVAVTNHGQLSTAQDNASAIFAQSLGGGGGNGGNSASVGAFVSLAIGGAGGAGGDASSVSVHSDSGSILTGANYAAGTLGHNSHGIFAQSLGGGGGNGGFAASLAVGIGGAVSIGIGGTGGDGGDAKAVTVSNGSTITTHGNDAHAIYAESAGGGGGSGGFSIAVAAADTFAAALSIGGQGGAGGEGDVVALDNAGAALTTYGDRSYGILAQSLGGGGGNGGFAVSGALSVGPGVAFGLSVGGSGASGGRARAVTLDSTSNIDTHGNDAPGIYAQSLGGGGGNGGFAVSGGLSGAVAANISVGGSGAKGGSAGTVTVGEEVFTGGTIHTRGDRSGGLVAQSVGGGGGAGGFSVAGSGGYSGLSANLSIGGAGGDGRDGDAVKVHSASSVTTEGDEAAGIFAQSLGGGGGKGGFSVVGGFSAGGTIGATIGGSGGDGGSAGSVEVTSTGEITTSGWRSHGLQAQSIGGGGGDGGFSIAGGISQVGSASFSLGGAGGPSGVGRDVAVTSTSKITTHGAEAHGLLAQSVSKGGGSGGFSVAGGISQGGALSASLGGSGGAGGDSGRVFVTTTGEHTGKISTDGDKASGIFAQSVGGGGGAGGFSIAGGLSKGPSASFTLGGSGGAGGNSNSVFVDSGSSVATLGNDSHGIFAQSLGGGGGAGGFSISGGITSVGSLSAALGGAGAAGGDGQNVTLLSSGALIETAGLRAYGIVAQSVGGGGGHGGFSVTGDISQGTTAALSMGGSGAQGGIGRDVTVSSSTSVRTLGDDSHGVFAQSLGGGGGSGGFSVAGSISKNALGASLGGSGGAGGDAGVVRLGNTATFIETGGERAYGMNAQSVGGGGGAGGFSVKGSLTNGASAGFSLGGSGSAGGDGNAVTLTNTARVATLGTDAYGLFAQSLGGGGGAGGFSVAGSLSVGGGSGGGGSGETPSAAAIKDIQINASIGGSGGAGGNANTVELSNSGSSITTLGTRAYGLLAQSIGGGGGSGGFSVAASISQGPAVNFSMGGSGGAGGIARDVTLNSSGNVSTAGMDAHAIFAQSVGGGGGAGGFSVAASLSSDQDSGAITASIGGAGSTGGNAGNVKLGTFAPIDGRITTLGERAHGIFAQSVGGGGGAGGFSVGTFIGKGDGLSFSLGGSGDKGGNAGLVDVRSAGSITTFGTGAHGLLAQSSGGGGGSGGFSVSGNVSLESRAVGVSIGGDGGPGGNGANVNATSRGAEIVTWGERAHGLFAQSLGGGGGDGGFSVAGSLTKKGGAVNVSVGGSGGIAGFAGDTTVHSASNITTHGSEAHAINAQSLGGGGGAGGFSVAGALSWAESADAKDVKINVSVGGSGSGGGKAGAVNVGSAADFVSGRLTTFGDGAYGIYAQSLGGGGGSGGFSVAGGLTRSPTINVGIGGSAGTASDGGAVQVFSASDISTQGKAAHGIGAQSIGGGGGKGGFSIAGSATTALTAVNASVGGTGGGGGKSSTVDVVNRGRIATFGASSAGVLAESIGGGGGDGGFSVAGSLSKPPSGEHPKGPRNINVAVGGTGGSGNAGAAVHVTNAGSIDTFGSEAHGVLAHSVGGGGGKGGFAGAGSLGINTTATEGSRAVIAVAVGGFGGDANVGGAVDVDNTQAITTRGEKARGIYAYSVGGGGGQGGASFAIDTQLGKPHEGNGLNLETAVGGFGGTGNDGGAVAVANSGTIITLGARADAIYAQSIGGGGGDGGKAHAVSLDFYPDEYRSQKPAKNEPGREWNFLAAVGGSGAGASDGGTVSVTNSGDLITHGVNARGIVAQSVGGGGGSGGSGINGTGLDLSLPNPIDQLLELADLKDKNILDLRNWSVLVGGSGGASGDADAVTVVNSGNVLTTGVAATAIHAQSIGGGGGEAQNFASGTGAGSSVSTGIQGKFAIGGGGGAAGDGGAVDITNSGTLVTLGEDAHGIFAQSIGGGGGVAGNVDRWLKDPIGPIPALNLGVGLAFGQDGGNAGDGAAVTVTNDGDIFTHGVGAFGIFAQSIGGGGGVAGGLGNTGTFLAPILSLQNFAGSTGGDGSAGAVTIHQTGNIGIAGNAADAILAQSTASKGFGGAVNIEVSGHIDAGAADAHGIRAQSRGDLGAGDIAITLDAGSVRGGTQSGAAVAFEGGAANTLTNRGSIGRSSELERLAVRGSSGNESVHNFGALAGSIDLGSGSNSLVNEAAGLLLSGLRVELGTQGTALNRGVWSIGALSDLTSTRLGGSLQQTSTGELLLDYDHASMSADHLAISGSAELSGTLVLHQMNLAAMKPGFTQVVLASAADAMSSLGLKLRAPASVVMQSALAVSGHDLVLSLAKDFAPLSLEDPRFGPTTQAVGQYMNRVQLAGSAAGMAPMIERLVAFGRVAELAQAYQLMSPLGYATLAVSQLHSGLRFGQSLLDCKSSNDGYRITSDGNCGWMAIDGQREERDHKPSAIGYTRDAGSIAGGVQRALNDTWRFGFAGSYERDSIGTLASAGPQIQDSAGIGLRLGAVLKASMGDSTFAVGFTAARHAYDTTRRAFLAEDAHSDESIAAGTLQVRLAHAFDFQRWYLRPQLELGRTYLHMGDLVEVGAGASNLIVADITERFTHLRPSLEAGIDVPLDAGVARFHAHAALTRFVSGGHLGVAAKLAGAPQDVADFKVTQRMDRTVRELAMGMDLVGTDGFTLRIAYTGELAASGTLHGGSIRLSWPLTAR